MERVFIVLVALAILYSTADCSTTTGPILIPFAEGCWAQCQLSNGIRYVSVTSKPLNPPTLQKLVFLKVHELDGRFRTNRSADSGSDCRRLLGMAPAAWWYKVHFGRIKAHGSAGPSEICLWTNVMEGSIADSSTTASPILDLIAGGCWPRRQPHNGIRSCPSRPLFMRLQGPR